MKKILLLLILFFGSISSLSAETSRIVSGNKNAKISKIPLFKNYLSFILTLILIIPLTFISIFFRLN